MISSNSISDTFLPVEDDIDFNGAYGNPTLLISTASARIYRISRGGKRMLLKTPIDESGRNLELLKREYALGVGLSHPNVAAIYTWEPSTSVGPGILMEYVDGRTLGEFLAEKPSFNARRRVWRQLLEAVNYIHKHGVTHNDLKPGNIMVSRANDDVKVIDFGLADADSEAIQRQLGGTARYASPELSARDASADMRSDIYSLGVIMQDIFPDRYRSLWRKCMARNPQDRYRNIDTLIKAWRRRQKLPALIWSIVGMLVLSMVIAFGIVKIDMLNHDVAISSQTTREMTDTISALRKQQLAASDSISTLRKQQLVASDSISSLNLQLSEISHDKAMTDSLSQAYIASCRRVIEKYKTITRNMRCVDEAYHMYKLFDADMDRNDSIFLCNNPIAGRDIYDRYGMSLRLQGSTEIEALAKKLPTLQQLTSDLDEQMRVYPLIHSGQPWSLKSDKE